MSDDIDYIPRLNSTWRRLPAILRELEARDRIAPADVEAANADMQRLGLRTRYRPDGAPYLIDIVERAGAVR